MSLLEKIYDLAPEQSTVLFSETVNKQLIEVREYEGYRWLQLGGDFIQGLMDVDAPSEILLPNIQVLLASLFIHLKPNRLLNLGFGCGSIERFLNEKLPELEITSLESNEVVIGLAKEFFNISDTTHIIHAPAEDFLENEKTLFDIILCDIFIDEEHPACLYEKNFYANIFKCLEEKGILAINLLPESEEDVVNILLPIKNHFNHISLFEVPNHFNAIIFASSEKLPAEEELEAGANKLYEMSGLDLRDVPQGLNRLLETL